MEAKSDKEAIFRVRTVPALPCTYPTYLSILLYSLLLIYDEGRLNICIN